MTFLTSEREREMRQLNPKTRNEILSEVTSIHNALERMASLTMNLDEFLLMDNYNSNLSNILDALNDIRFQTSDDHSREQSEEVK